MIQVLLTLQYLGPLAILTHSSVVMSPLNAGRELGSFLERTIYNDQVLLTLPYLGPLAVLTHSSVVMSPLKAGQEPWS